MPFSLLQRQDNYMLSIMRFATLDLAVVTPFKKTGRREQLKHEDLVHLLLDAARITAYRSTRRTEIDSKNGTRNDERKGRALGHVPAVKGGASWYPRAPRGSRLRGPRRPVLSLSRDSELRAHRTGLRTGSAS